MTLAAVFVSTVAALFARQALGLVIGVPIGLGCMLLFFAVVALVDSRSRPR